MADKLTFSFGNCDAGWIELTIEVNQKKVKLDLSWAVDPFPDIIAWLESISRNIEEAAFTLDEEGHEVCFRYKRSTDGISMVFSLVSGSTGEMLAVEVDRFQLVSEFYTKLKEYGRSDRYIPAQWESETLFDKLKKHYALNLTRREYVAFLRKMSGQAIRKYFRNADDSFDRTFPGLR